MIEYPISSLVGDSGLKLKVSDAWGFKALFRCVTRFAEKAHFDVQKTGIRIRSIDPHDFCYVDARLAPSFFEDYDLYGDKFSFGADISKLKYMLANIHKDTPVFLEINDGNLQLHLISKWKTTYKLDWLATDPYDLPEPLKFDYKVNVEIAPKDFFSVIKDAAAVSHEICFSAGNGKLKATSSNGDFSFASEIDVINGISKIKPVRSFAIIDYLRTLYDLIDKCESVRLGIGEELPLRVNLSYKGKGSFSFIISNRKLKSKEKKSKGGMSIPHLSVTKFPEFLEFLGTSAEGVDSGMLRLAQLETEGEDYTRLAAMLELSLRKKGKVFLTTEGKKFVLLLQQNPEKAKRWLHIATIKKLPPYKAIMKHLIERPLSTTEIYEKVNATLRRKSLPEIHRQDLVILLGLATWCRAVDRKLALYYFGKEDLEGMNDAN